jgi:transcriptional regulator with XRE-family HTH domain
MSQEGLGHSSGLDRSYVGGVERGERNPSYAALLKIAAALERPLSEVLRRAEQIS